MDDDTIAALSTPAGRGGIAVIRISGSQTQNIINQVFTPVPKTLKSQKVYHGYVVEGDKKIDECLLTFFQNPHSFTGDDLAELSVHSNPHLIEAILGMIFSLNARIAMPGEFSYRAFKNGKIDLIQAESINELIHANSQYSALMKFNNLEGRLSQFVSALKEQLVQLGIKVETILEFQEDQTLEEIHLSSHLKKSMDILANLLENARYNDLLNDGLKVAIVGKVNVGKSSLFNTLLMTDRVIVSPIPGTTRDFIQEKIYIEGIPIDLIDCAGIHGKSQDGIEEEGINRSYELIQESDAVIFILDSSGLLEKDDEVIYQLVRDKKKIVVANKHDIISGVARKEIETHFAGETLEFVSVKDKMNVSAIHRFLKTLALELKDLDTPFLINQRQKSHLVKLKDLLAQIWQMVENQISETELLAEEIRSAIRIIGELTGEVTTEDLLEGIFSQFCVGK